MLDRAIQTAIQPLLTRAARQLVTAGIGANAVTVTGFLLGMAAAGAIALQAYGVGLALLLLSPVQCSPSAHHTAGCKTCWPCLHGLHVR